MLILGDPGQAFHLAAIPNAGVGLARIEFIVTNHIGIHPMALAQFPNLKDVKAVNEIRARIAGEDPREFFIRRLTEGVARIARTGLCAGVQNGDVLLRQTLTPVLWRLP